MPDNKVAHELQDIKRLLILLLIKINSSSEEIGAALGMHPGAVRKWVPAGKIAKLNFRG